MSARPKLVGDAEWIDPLLALGAQPAPQPGVQEHCHVCGLVDGGCFGFGVSRKQPGVWACTDPDCRAKAAARARGRSLTVTAGAAA